MLTKEIFSDALKQLPIEKQTLASMLLDDLIRIEEQLEFCRSKPFIKYHPDMPSLSKPTTEFMLYNKLLTQKNNLVRTLNNVLRNIGGDEDENPLTKFKELAEQKFGVKL